MINHFKENCFVVPKNRTHLNNYDRTGQPKDKFIVTPTAIWLCIGITEYQREYQNIKTLEIKVIDNNVKLC